MLCISHVCALHHPVLCHVCPWPSLGFYGGRLQYLARSLPRVCYLCVRHTEGWQGTQRALQGRCGAPNEGHKARQQEETLRLGTMYVDSKLVFTKEEGDILLPPKVWQHFARLLQLNGPPRFPFHALTHRSNPYVGEQRTP